MNGHRGRYGHNGQGKELYVLSILEQLINNGGEFSVLANEFEIGKNELDEEFFRDTCADVNLILSTNMPSSFKDFMSYFNIYDDVEDCVTLTPYKILLDVYDVNCDLVEGLIKLVNREINIPLFLSQLKHLDDKLKTEIVNNIKEEFLNYLPQELDNIFLLSTSVRARLRELKKLDFDFYNSSSISLIFAIYLLNKKATLYSNDYMLTQYIINYFNNSGMNFNNIILKDKNDFDNLPEENPAILPIVYKNPSGLGYSNCNAAQVLNIALNDYFVKDVLDNIGVIKSIDLSMDDLNDTISKLKNDASCYIKENFTEEQKEFFIYALKVYNFLIKNGGINHFSETVIKELSIYLASEYYDSTFKHYFNSKGITLDKVKKYLTLHINIDDILNTEVDINQISDIFGDFIFQGMDVTHAKKISIDGIVSNLCNKDTFVKIFNALSNKEFVANDFTDDFRTFVNEKLEKISFNRMLPETIDYLKVVSKLYQYYSNNKINNSVATIYSLIGALSVIDFELSDIGLLDNMISKDLLDELPIDLIVIEEYFNDYIYAGYNKEKDQITIRDILANVFNKDLFNLNVISDYPEVMELITRFPTLDDFNSDYEKKLEKRKQELELRKIGYKIDDIELTNLLKVYERIKKLIDIDSHAFIKSEDDIIQISTLIYRLYSNKLEKQDDLYIERSGVTLDNILEYYHLDSSVVDIGISINLNDLLYNYYRKYLTKDCDLEQLIRNILLDKELDHSVIKNMTNHFGLNYNQSIEEIIRGTNYEPTNEEQMEWIKKEEKAKRIDPSNTRELMLFGSRISPYAKYPQIDRKAITAMESLSGISTSVLSVVDKIGDVAKLEGYKPLEVQKSFLSIFRKKNSIKNESESSIETAIDENFIKDLEITVEFYRNSLRSQILYFDSRLAFYKRYGALNESFLLVLKDIIIELEEGLNKANTSDMNPFSPKVSNKDLLIRVNASLNTFETSDLRIKMIIRDLTIRVTQNILTVYGFDLILNNTLPIMMDYLIMNENQKLLEEATSFQGSIYNLLRNLINQNVDDAKDNALNLKTLLPGNLQIDKLISDIDRYGNMIEEQTDLLSNINSSFEEDEKKVK